MLTDRPAWSDEAGLVEKTKYSFDFLDLDLEGLNAVAGRGAAAGGMEWELAWAVDKTRPDADPDGWLYAVDFPSAWGIRTTATCVRRRKWVPAPQASASSASAATRDEPTAHGTDECKTCDTFENQRWLPLVGFSARLLPTDRSAWSDEFGHLDMPLSAFDHWLKEGWECAQGWEVDSWQYATDFPSLDWTLAKTALSCVRRRRWSALLVPGDAQHTTIPMAADFQRDDGAGTSNRGGTCMLTSASESISF